MSRGWVTGALYFGYAARVVRALPLLVLVACGPPLVEDRVGGLRRLSGVVRTGRDGQVPLKLRVAPDERALLLTVQPVDPGLRAHVVEVRQEGEVVFDATEEARSVRATTNAGFISTAATLSWPRIPSDTFGDLAPRLGRVTPSSTYDGGELAVEVLFKADDDLDAGTLQVAFVYAGDTGDDPDLLDAMARAEAVWRDLYASFGLDLSVTEVRSWPDADLAAPVYGTDSAYAAIAEAVGPGVVPVVVTDDITDVEEVLGIAGDIPGPLVPSPRTGILVSAVTSAGVDGVFQDEEIRLLGETLAHETGHYLGLFHPVETTWDRWDALDDTPECGGEKACTNKMADYLMFPFPVCGFLSCVPQTVITDDQAWVAHHYAGVD